jgi:nucleotide-binding universal stress UspA family protein
MKTILIPIDFSETTNNTIIYAVKLANYFSANLILMHVVSIPVITDENNVLQFTIADSIELNLEALKNKADWIKKECNLIGDITYYSETGDFKTCLEEFTQKTEIDLVIMSITEYHSNIGKFIFGSNAVAFAKTSQIPILIVPKNYNYKKITNIAFACEYDENIKTETILLKTKSINSLFNSELSVLHVIPENHLINKKESELDFHIENKLETVRHKTYIITDNNVSNGILDFINTHNIELLIIEQKKHSILHNLLHHSVTKELAFKTEIPLLTIHG